MFNNISSIIKAQANVDALKAWKDTELPLPQALSSEITIQRENLIYHLGEEWKKLAVWKLPSTKGVYPSYILFFFRDRQVGKHSKREIEMLF